jgi:hypothetical protein
MQTNKSHIIKHINKRVSLLPLYLCELLLNQKIVVHELGHGAFALQHPFHEFAGFPQGGKDVFNIMNYGNKRNKFRKYQWEIIDKTK